MKKIASLILAAVMTLALAGCDSKEQSGGEISDSSTSTTSSDKSSKTSQSSSKTPADSSEPADSSGDSVPEKEQNNSEHSSSDPQKESSGVSTESTDTPQKPSGSSQETSPTTPAEPPSSTAGSGNPAEVPSDPEPEVGDDYIRPEAKEFVDKYVEIVSKCLVLLEGYEDASAEELPEEISEQLEKYSEELIETFINILMLGEFTPAENAYMEEVFAPVQAVVDERFGSDFMI